MANKLTTYVSNKIADYLEKQIEKEPDFLNNIYSQTAYEFPRLSEEEINNLRIIQPFNRQASLKQMASAYRDSSKEALENNWQWIVKTWGGIKKFDVSRRINELYDEKTYKGNVDLYLKEKLCSLQSISSISKIASFTKPAEWFVYDSRVTYVLNWLLYKYDDKHDLRYFIIPNSYSDRRGVLTKRIGNGLIYYNNCYNIYCELIRNVSRVFPWDRFSIEDKRSCMIEMILFALGKNGEIIDSEIRRAGENSRKQSNHYKRKEDCRNRRASNENAAQPSQTQIMLKVYDGHRQDNIGRTLQIINKPHVGDATEVYLEFNGKSYKASVGTYNQGTTLRGVGKIDRFIEENHMSPGYDIQCRFENDNGTHKYIVDHL